MNIALGATNVAAGAIFLCPDIRDLRILGVQGKLLAEGMMRIVRRAARTHCLPIDWMVCRLLDDPDAVCQRSGQDVLNDERAHRPSAWWQAACPLRNKCRGCATLGALRQARPVGSCHGPQATRRARSGHVPAPDPYSCRGPPRPGTFPRPGPYSEGSDAHPSNPTCLLGSSGLVHTGVRCPSVEVRTQ
jgi:hypothetical protein